MPGGPAVALAGHPFPGHLVVGFVAGQAFPDPALVDVGIAIDHPEEVGEAEGPVVHEFGRVQQPLDQFLPLQRIPVGQEFAHALGGRQRTREVQADPPQEGGVAREARWNDVQFSQPVENQVVDEIPSGYLRVVVQRLSNHTAADLNQLPGRPYRHSGLSRLEGPHHARRGDVNDSRIAALVKHLGTQVFTAAVFKEGGHQQSPRSSGLHDRFPRKNLQALDPGLRRTVPVGSPLANPLQQPPVVGRVPLEALSAPMGQFQHGLQQQSALLRLFQVDPRIEGLGGLGRQHLVDPTLDGPAVVLPGVDSVQGQLEPAPALDAAVALAAVATVAGKDPDHVASEVEGPDFSRASDPNRRCEPLAGHIDTQFQLSVTSRRDHTVCGDLRQPLIRHTEAAVRGDINFQTPAVFGQDQERMRAILPPKAHVRWNQAKALQVAWRIRLVRLDPGRLAVDRRFRRTGNRFPGYFSSKQAGSQYQQDSGNQYPSCIVHSCRLFGVCWGAKSILSRSSAIRNPRK